MTNIIDDLAWRGAVNQVTDEEGLRELLETKAVSVYCGVDPTGDSLHIGHLIPFMVLKRFQEAGHRPVILIGGATGSIGDPSGKSEERNLQSMDVVNNNAQRLTAMMKQLFMQDADSDFRIFNNYDWTVKLNLLDFLRTYGKRFNINTMLAKDIVSSRLETGISFTEFAYQILQAMDYLHLYREADVQLQIGGADQWGNITAGLELIRKEEGPEAQAFGLTIPLMLKADGTKFGKTAGGAVWLDPEKTSPYEFYQFWINQDDADVVKYLKYFTFLSQAEIDELAASIERAPEKRQAQTRLAEEVTRFVHGEDGLHDAQVITQALFSGQVQELTGQQIAQGFKNMPGAHMPKEDNTLAVWLVDAGIEPSRRQSREDIKNGAIRINGERITDVDFAINPELAIEDKYVIVRRGKKKYFLVTFD